MRCSARLILGLRARIADGGKKCGLLAVVSAIAWFLSGCTAAYNARTVNSPDCKYATTCYIRGSLGRSYLADTKKKIIISIYALSPDAKERAEREKEEALKAGVWSGPGNPGAIVTATNALLYRKEYRVKGSDLNWSSVWGEEDNLTIVFYDYGAGVEIPYSSQNIAPKRFLRTMNYQFDSGLGIYKEVPSK